jgi:esterase/lipase superfamily enzyme
MVSRNFNETIGYVTDRKAGPLAGGNVTYLGEYAGQASYGLINVEVPQHHPSSSPIDGGAIRKVYSIPYPAFLKFLQDQSGRPLVIWIHGYRASFPVSTVHCAQVARALNIDANVLTFDWASSESVLGYTRDVLQIPRSTKHLVDLLEAMNSEIEPPKIIIIAHSLGCRLVCLALEKLYNDPNLKSLKLDHVIFIAPNVDREDFDQNFKPALQTLVNRLTIYVASDDNVLLLGKLLYNVDSIGLPEQFSPDTNLDKIQTFLYYEKLPGRLTWSMFPSPRKRTFLKSIVSFLRDLSWKIYIG